MYNIRQLAQDSFEIYSPYFPGQVRGTQLEILTIATFKFGFKPDELQVALLDMLEKDHDTAHFGINGFFIYSFNFKTVEVA